MVELVYIPTIVESSMEVRQNAQNRPTIWPRNSTPRNLPKEYNFSDSKKHMESPDKIKTRTTHMIQLFQFRYLSEEYKNTNSKRYMHSYVYRSTIYNSQDMEAT